MDMRLKASLKHSVFNKTSNKRTYSRLLLTKAGDTTLLTRRQRVGLYSKRRSGRKEVTANLQVAKVRSWVSDDWSLLTQLERVSKCYISSPFYRERIALAVWQISTENNPNENLNLKENIKKYKGKSGINIIMIAGVALIFWDIYAYT